MGGAVDNWIGVEAACRLLFCSRIWIFRLGVDRKIRRRRAREGGHWQYLRSDVLAVRKSRVERMQEAMDQMNRKANDG